MLTRTERELLAILADLDQIKAATRHMFQQEKYDGVGLLIEHAQRSVEELIEVVETALDMAGASRS